MLSRLKRSRTGVLVGTAIAVLALLGGASPILAAQPVRQTGPYVAPSLQRRAQTNPTQRVRVIVQLKSSAPAVRGSSRSDAETALGLVRQHGRGGSALGIIRGASGEVPASEVSALAKDPRIAAVYEDVRVKRSSMLQTAYPDVVDATDVWNTNGSGLGVTVAVLDSGISQHPDLTSPTNRIVTEVNFADPLPVGMLDPGGHGTHVAGIIAGNGADSGGAYVGVAPKANLVDVRVLDAAGNGSASSVIAGIQWAVANKDLYGIRVLNLSFGTPPLTDYIQDPIAAAVEIAWLRGMVVVSAAGNGGLGAVDSPAIDPHFIAVGASDDNATGWRGDDSVPIWSGSGLPTGSDAKPDIVAPGRRIVSLRDPGSTLDLLLPDRVVGTGSGANYFRLSGTSMATGVVSGVVALLLEAQPTLTPDQVKLMLTGTARPFGWLNAVAVPGPMVGAGSVSARAAIAAAPPVVVPRNLRIADAAAQALYPLLLGQPLTWKDPAYAGIDWTQINWTNLVWDNLVWDNLVWDSFNWNNLVWDNVGWSNLVWDSVAWSNLVWDTDPINVPD